MTTTALTTNFLQAMIALNEIAQELDLEEDHRAINGIWHAAKDLRQTMKIALNPAANDTDLTPEGRLAYEAFREADARYACIQTILSASQAALVRLASQPRVNDGCIVCNRAVELDDHGACQTCNETQAEMMAEYRVRQQQPWRDVGPYWRDMMHRNVHRRQAKRFQAGLREHGPQFAGSPINHAREELDDLTFYLEVLAEQLQCLEAANQPIRRAK